MSFSTSATLLSLPPELMLEISDHLPLDALIALKLTHRILNNTLPPGPRLNNAIVSPCSGFAISAHLARQEPNPSHMRCILCKALYPVSLFHSANSPACLAMSCNPGEPPKEVIELPKRFCAWHVGRLTRIIRVPRGDRHEWISTKETICLHCGKIRGWRVCTCDCQSCGTREVRVYTRYMESEAECSQFQFWRDDESEKGVRQLFVREKHWNRGEDIFPRSYTVDIPVRFEEPDLGRRGPEKI